MNKDFYGVDIRDERAPLVDQALQLGEFIAIQGFVPISVASSMRHQEVTGKYSGISFVGFNIAPSYVTKTKIQKEIFDLVDRKLSNEKSREEWDISQKKSEVKKLLQQKKFMDAFTGFKKLQSNNSTEKYKYIQTSQRKRQYNHPEN